MHINGCHGRVSPRGIREQKGMFVKPSLVQLTKREWAKMRTSHSLWTGMLATGLVLGLIAPFGTDTGLTPIPRVLYWTVICIITFVTGNCLTGAITRWAEDKGWPFVARVGFALAISGSVIVCQVLALNTLVLDAAFTRRELINLAVIILAIVVVVTIATLVITRREAQTTDEPPRLLTRLPLHLRGPLLSLSVDDHYVHVSTELGTDMILLRLSDAIAETAPTAGFQIHRSHWVAQNAVEKVERKARSFDVILKDGKRLPVSRTYVPQLKEAGLLPKSDA